MPVLNRGQFDYKMELYLVKHISVKNELSNTYIKRNMFAFRFID